MTANDMQDLIIATLTRGVGGTKREWRLAVGPVRVRSVQTHPHCNWSVEPAGTSREITEIQTLLDDLRLRFPILHDA